MSEYPKRDASGGLYWACCVSSIGPDCQHVTMPDGSVQHPVLECECEPPYADCTHPPVGEDS